MLLQSGRIALVHRLIITKLVHGLLVVVTLSMRQKDTRLCLVVRNHGAMIRLIFRMVRLDGFIEAALLVIREEVLVYSLWGQSPVFDGTLMLLGLFYYPFQHPSVL